MSTPPITPPITPEKLAAFADGELDGERGAEIAAAVAADPALQAKVDGHRALKAKLAAHFAPLAQAPVPDRLTAMLGPAEAPQVIDFAAAKARAEEKRRLPRWSWIAGPALAASLALAVFLPRGAGGLAENNPQLAAALDSQLVSEQASDAQVRILLSFRNDAGEFCRAYSLPDESGIACNEGDGWTERALAEAVREDGGTYRQAGSEEILAMAQDMATGGALSAEEEREAREAGWR